VKKKIWRLRRQKNRRLRRHFVKKKFGACGAKKIGACGAILSKKNLAPAAPKKSAPAAPFCEKKIWRLRRQKHRRLRRHFVKKNKSAPAEPFPPAALTTATPFFSSFSNSFSSGPPPTRYLQDKRALTMKWHTLPAKSSKTRIITFALCGTVLRIWTRLRVDLRCEV